MNKIQERFWLAIIFIGQRVVLAFSLIGVVYFAVWLTYQKIIFEPKINEFNYEITLLQEKRNPIDVSLQSLLPKIGSVNEEIATLEPELTIQQSKVEKLNETVEEECKIFGKIPNPIPLPIDSPDCRIARKILEEDKVILPKMEDQYDAFVTSQKDMLENKDDLEQQIKDINDDIGKVEQSIRDFENKNHNPFIGLYFLIFGAI
ncbi:hypothetical protein [Paraglaciecola sp.]|uniref:hypothetical protein n=1 Tax=Paraglaciecola sp. TaxID=1920173 RepID=UPI003EF25BC4